MSVREGQDKTLAEALALSQQLELNLLREGQNVDVVERNSGASVYKLQRS